MADRNEKERRVVRKAIRALVKSGFKPSVVHDGEGTVRVRTEAEAIDAVFAVDIARLSFKPFGSIVVTSGEGPLDCISDWTFRKEGDTFDATMDAVLDDVQEQFPDE